MEPLEPDDARELLALERLIRRADAFALAFARVDSPVRRRELVGTLLERLDGDVRVVPVAVPPETTDLESLLAQRYAEVAGDSKVALFVVGIERVLSSVRERNGFLPVLNYKRENLQRAVPCPVVLWLPEFALRLVAQGAPDLWAWRSGVFEFTSPRDETDRTWEAMRDSGSVDEYARLMPAERQTRIETMEALYHDYSDRADADNPAQLAIQRDLADRLGRLYREKPDYETAIEWARRAVNIAKLTLNEHHPDVLTSMDNLGLILHARGDLMEAEQIHRQVLRLREQALGPNHRSTLTAVNNLGFITRERGDIIAAEKLYRRALEGRIELLGTDHPETLVSMTNLASLLELKGDLDESEQIHRQALIGKESALGSDHPSTLASINNMGHLMRTRGNVEMAERLYRRALDGAEKALGPDHPNTLKSLNNLAGALAARGDVDGAERLFRRALDGAERVLGPDHASTGLYRSRLDALLSGMDNAGP